VNNPYKIPRPAQISFSGGRSSAFMLWNILKAYEYKLPDDIYVIFANTGKEDEKTLEFIKKIEDNWKVKIYWLEFDTKKTPPFSKKRSEDIIYKEVNFETASRNGEPFKKLIDYRSARDRYFITERKNQDKIKNGINFLPNPLARYCTDLLKIKSFDYFMKNIEIKQYNNIVGLRYDEPRRVTSIKKSSTKRIEIVVPMYEAEHTKEDISKFWNDYWFDLELPNVDGVTPHGNCDLCFLKNKKNTEMIIRENPNKADWWIQIEEENKNVFRINRPSYKKLKEMIISTPSLFDDENNDEDLGDCFCTD
tara:strand:+ start:77 stop:997 length:921 start_codon:yes stop_codon:yes gene_type:complete